MNSQKFMCTVRLQLTTIFLSFLIMVFTLASSGYAKDPLERPEEGQENSEIDKFVKNQLVIKFIGSSASSDTFNEVVSNATTLYQLSSGAILIEYNDPTDIERAASSLSSLSVVEYVHPNYLLDPLHPVQGSLPFSDQAQAGDYQNQPPTSMLNLDGAHQLATGIGITIGLIDGGVDDNFDELAGHIFSGYDYVDGDNDPFDVAGGPTSGHGTFIAGVIRLGAPDTDIRAYRIFDSTGLGNGFDLALAIEQAALDGCDIINLSVTLYYPHQAVNDAIDFAVDMGVIVVAAAGNEGSNIRIYPAAYSNAFCVAAIDTNMQLSNFSTFGYHIDVCAPGEDVYSTFQSSEYAWWSGTSFAAPFVSAQAALLKERNSGATNAEILYSIKSSASSLDAYNPDRLGSLGAGFSNPMASIYLIDSLATAEITPDTLFFESEAGALYFAPFFGSALLSSSITDAPYTIELAPSSSRIAWATGVKGVTDDTIRFEVNPSYIAVGTIYNTILFHVEGVVEPARLTVAINVIPPPNNVLVLPNQILVQGNIFTDVIIARTVFVSTFISPVAYSVVIPPSLSGLVEAVPPNGMTNDSVTFLINPSNALSTGFYQDSIQFVVDGVDNPGVLLMSIDIVDTSLSPQAQVSPSFINFDDTAASVGILQASVYLTSVNAPAAYSISINNRAQQYLQVFDSDTITGGFTNDTLSVVVITALLPGPGVYEDTVKFLVDSIAEPAVLYVTTTVRDVGDSGNYVAPTLQFFTSIEGVDSTQYGSVYVGTPADSVPYTAIVIDAIDFLWINDSVGKSNDSLRFELYSTAAMSPGWYSDTIAIFLQGETQPLISVVYLSVLEDSSGINHTATVTPLFAGFEAVAGQENVLIGSVGVSSTNAPSPFTVTLLDTIGSFTTLMSSSGNTNDSILYTVYAPLDMPIGVYADTLLFSVEGVSNSSLISVIYLQVDTVFGLVQASALPGFQAFVVSDGIDTVISGNVVISSDNAPSPYSIALSDSSSAFTTLLTTGGMTNDTAFFEVNVSAGMPTGLYTDTLWVNVDGAVVNFGKQFAVVYLQIGTGSDSASPGPVDEYMTIENFPNPFNPSTNIRFSLPKTEHVKLTIYNVLGQQVTRLLDAEFPAGQHTVTWNGQGMPSGIYFYRLQTVSETITRKMMLIK